MFQDPAWRAERLRTTVLFFNGKPPQRTRVVHNVDAVRKIWQKEAWITRKPLSDLKCKKEVQRRWKQGQAFCDECRDITPKLGV